MQALHSMKGVVSLAWSLQYYSWLKKVSELSRRDDIESLAYALLEMYVPGLPWFDRTDPESFEMPHNKIYEEKRSFLSCGAYLFMYPAFMGVLSYSRSLGFEETPDYELLQAMLVPLE